MSSEHAENRSSVARRGARLESDGTAQQASLARPASALTRMSRYSTYMVHTRDEHSLIAAHNRVENQAGMAGKCVRPSFVASDAMTRTGGITSGAGARQPTDLLRQGLRDEPI
jgi:hypothetical protein